MNDKIYERAKSASYQQLGRLSPAYEEGYVRGVCEQRAIDLELYKQELMQFRALLNRIKNNAGQLIDLENSLNEFWAKMEVGNNG